LSQTSDISGRAAETRGQNEKHDPAELEDALHRAIGEQEQALEALKRHQREHGC
jgi:hypothetical protein